MSRPRGTPRVAILFAALIPSSLVAQRVARPGAPYGIAVTPSRPAPATTAPQSGVRRGTSSSTATPRGYVRQPQQPSTLPRLQTSRPALGVARTYRPLIVPRVGVVHRARGRASCFGSVCGCIGVTRCFGGPLIVGYPLEFPVVVPYAYPIEVPIGVPMEPGVYGAPAGPPPVASYTPGPSKLIVIGAGNDGGGGALSMEQVSDSVLRLTWLGTTRPVREAKLFLADSMQRTLRSQRVDAASPSVLFDIAEVGRAIAYVGASVVLTDGATMITLVPYRGKRDAQVPRER
jgi:hypothetical protein